MKVAVQISGQQRYGEYLKDFLHGVSIFDEVDLFVHNWNNNKSSSEVVSFINQSHSFPNIHVRAVEVIAQINFNVNPTWRLREAAGSSIFNLMSMTYGINAVNEMRHSYERTHNRNYDLIIRSRSDLKLSGITSQSYFEGMLEGVVNLGDRPRYLSQDWHKEAIQDQIAIARPKTMDIYADLLNHFDEFHAEGRLFNPELYFYWWLKTKSSLKIIEQGFSVEMDERNAGRREDRAVY